MVRALLTPGEREAVRDSEDMDQNTKSSHISRIKNKIDKMAEDSQDLREHRPELYEELREAVCEDSVENRVADLEDEVQRLDQRVTALESDTQSTPDSPSD